MQPLLLKRARIVGAARDKLEQLSTHLKKQGRTPFNLIYCGDGSLEDDGESVRQIELVSRMLDQLGISQGVEGIVQRLDRYAPQNPQCRSGQDAKL